MTDKNKNISEAWDHAVEIYHRYRRRPVKTEILMSLIPSRFKSEERWTCQYLFLATIKNLRRIEWEFEQLMRKEPRSKLRAVLHIALGEILNKPIEEAAIVVNYAVDHTRRNFSKKEAGMVNAVLRKAVESIRDGHCSDQAGNAILYSHPDFLYDRWVKLWGEDAAVQLMEWNQEPPPMYIRDWSGQLSAAELGLEPSEWQGFYECSHLTDQLQEELNSGKIYIQDPSTRFASEFSGAKASEKILDLCAAPGGKSVALAHLLDVSHEQDSLLVSLEKDESRMELLNQNLRHFPAERVKIMQADLLEFSAEQFSESNLPTQYDAVLLDAPCSNTGVLRRRPDARWRLNEKDVVTMASIQAQMLRNVSGLVKSGGRLVYSTCSIEPEENELNVEEFLSGHPEFKLEKSKLSKPWQDGHDGGAAFLLLKA